MIKEKKVITKETIIEDLVEKHPDLVIPLREYGIVCIACGEPVWGTLGELMEEKNISDQKKIIDKLNNKIKKGKE